MKEILKQQFTTVTTFSKIFAMLLFIGMPFVGLYVGYSFAPDKVVKIEQTAVEDNKNLDLDNLYAMYKPVFDAKNIGHMQISEIKYNHDSSEGMWSAFVFASKIDTAGPPLGVVIVGNATGVKSSRRIDDLVDFRWTGKETFEYQVYLWCSDNAADLAQHINTLPVTDSRCKEVDMDGMLPITPSNEWEVSTISKFLVE
jgi:hypothetical protein